MILAIPGVLWVDVQVDGVKRGYVLPFPKFILHTFGTGLPLSEFHLECSGMIKWN